MGEIEIEQFKKDLPHASRQGRKETQRDAKRRKVYYFPQKDVENNKMHALRAD